MANEDTEQRDNLDFLEDEFVKNHFANTNMLLLGGKHIQSNDFHEYNLIQDNYKGLKYYYQELYNLVLEYDKRDDEVYYYLTFPENSKGQLSTPRRYRELEEEEVIIGIILINWYYEQYFENEKKITWKDIKDKILQSELSDEYKLLFFGELGREYTDKEWGDDDKSRKHTNKKTVKSRFRKTLNSFSRLGWIVWKDKDNLEFEIMSSIHRFAEKLYPNEINGFDAFINEYNKKYK